MKKILSLLICCLMLTGCLASQQPSESNPTTTLPSTPAVTTPSSTTPSTTTMPPSSSTLMPPSDVSFYLYAPNEAFDGFITYDALSSYPINPNQIMDWLREVTDFYGNVVVNSAVMEGSTLFLDVNDAFHMELLTMGSSGEKMLIGCLVNTFLSAYGADKVMLTAVGAAMNSGHVVYDFPLGYFK